MVYGVTNTYKTILIVVKTVDLIHPVSYRVAALTSKLKSAGNQQEVFFYKVHSFDSLIVTCNLKIQLPTFAITHLLNKPMKMRSL